MTQIVILAGGKGTRMNSEHPKVLQEINGRPLIDYLVTTIESSNFNIKPVVVVGYKADMVKDYLGNRVTYAYQAEQLGTGHAVACAKDKIEKDIKNIVVLNGDMPFITYPTIENLINNHEQLQAALSVISVKVNDFKDWRESFYNLGRIVRSDNDLVEKIVEFKDANSTEKEIREINTAYFCFDTTWLWHNIKKLSTNNSASEYYITDLVAMARQQGDNIASIIASDPREGIGINTVDHLTMARMLKDKNK